MFPIAARLLHPLLRLLLHLTDRRRTTESAPSPATLPARCRPRVPALGGGEAIGLVQPYVIARERSAERERKRRRAGLVMAPQGIRLPKGVA
ncbi:hypothetical protein GCM10009564_23400 [Streptomyces thermogriseus]